MGMQAIHDCAGGGQQRRQFANFAQRDSELGVGAGGTHVMVVSTARTGIDAYQQTPAGKQLGPLAQGVQVVDGDVDTLAQRKFVFAAWREVRREQHFVRRMPGSDANTCSIRHAIHTPS